MVGYNTGVKEPPYTLLKTDGAYELREYPSIVMVSAYTQGSFDDAQNKSFQKLFGYISGENTASEEIPMTAPVLMKRQGTEIPMTTPVLMQQQESGWAMSFVLPASFTKESAPKPKDTSLNIEERINVKYAVLKFNGFFNEDNFIDRTNELKTWIEKNNLKPAGSAMRAGYNPPWTLPPFRRNEILTPVK